MQKYLLSLLMSVTLVAPAAFAKEDISSPVQLNNESVEDTKGSPGGGGGGGGGQQHSAPAQHSSPAPAQRSAPAPRPSAPAPRPSAPAQRSAPAPRPSQPAQSRPAQPSRPSTPAQQPSRPSQPTQSRPAQTSRPSTPAQQPSRPAQQPSKPAQPSQPSKQAGRTENRPEQKPSTPSKPAQQPSKPSQPSQPNKQAGKTENRPEQKPSTPTRTTAGQPKQQTKAPATEGRARDSKIEAPSAPKAQVKGQPVRNKDNSVTTHYQDGSSVRKGANGKVISQYDASSHKTVYSNKDGSTTVAQGNKSVRTYENGNKVVHNNATHETSTFDKSRNQTTIRAPGKQITIDHKSGAIDYHGSRESYHQTPLAGGRGYTRNVTINNVNITRVYNYNTNRFGYRSAYYYPGIYSAPFYGLYVGGFYGGFGYAGPGYYVTPWNYGWSYWHTYPAEVCWWGGCNYVGYGYRPFSPFYSWRADYGYYYTPVVQIVNPVDYILGTVIAEALESRRQSRLDAEAAARQDALDAQAALREAQDDEDTAAVLKAQADEELKEAQAEKARNADVVQDQSQPMSQEAIEAQKTTINHVTTEIAQKTGDIDVVDFLTSDKGAHGFQVSDQLTVGVDGTDKECTLDEGDTVELNPGFVVNKDTTNVLVKVLSSVPGDCRPGKVVNVGIEKLQDMLNATVEKVNDAMTDMATKKMGQQK